MTKPDRYRERIDELVAYAGEPLVRREGGQVSVLVNARIASVDRTGRPVDPRVYDLQKPIRVGIETRDVETVATYIHQGSDERNVIRASEDGGTWIDEGLFPPEEGKGSSPEDLAEFLLRLDDSPGTNWSRRECLDGPCRYITGFRRASAEATQAQADAGKAIDVDGARSEAKDWIDRNFRMDIHGKVHLRLPPGMIPKWILQVQSDGGVLLRVSHTTSNPVPVLAEARFPLHEASKAMEVANAIAGKLGSVVTLASVAKLKPGWKAPGDALLMSSAGAARDLLAKGASLRNVVSPQAAAAIERLRDATSANRKGFSSSLPKAWAELAAEVALIENDGTAAYRRLRANAILMEEMLKAYAPAEELRKEPFPLSMADRIMRNVPESPAVGDAYRDATTRAREAMATYRESPDEASSADLVEAFETLAEAVPHDFANGQEALNWGAHVRPRLRRLVALAHGMAPEHDRRQAGP